jgi:hypothetical protein
VRVAPIDSVFVESASDPLSFPSCKGTEIGKYAFVMVDYEADDEMSTWVDYDDMAAIVNSDTCTWESKGIGKANKSIGSSLPDSTRILNSILEACTCAWAISLMRRHGMNLQQEGA